MRTIRISEEVWHALVRRGKSGETMDEVLRRILRVGKAADDKPASKEKPSTRTMTAKVIGDKLLVVFGGGVSKDWRMPPRRDRTGVGKVLRSAARFAEKHGASDAQVKRIERALEDAGYYLRP